MNSNIDYSTYKFTCSCPDAAKLRVFNLKENSPPLVQDWSNSDAGAQDGICKHIWAVRIMLNLVKKEDIPNDVPIDTDELEDNRNFESWQSGYGGHAFTPTKEGFAPNTFKFYRGG